MKNIIVFSYFDSLTDKNISQDNYFIISLKIYRIPLFSFYTTEGNYIRKNKNIIFILNIIKNAKI